MAEAQSVEVRSRAELRDWLSQNHATSGTVWLVLWKKHTPYYIDFGDVVSELLCWGWIDSVTRAVDADRSSYRISPRNPKSAWSAVNKAKIEEARAGGQMTAAGESLISAAKANGMWSFLDDVERLERPHDLNEALVDLIDEWQAYPRSVKRGTLEWIKTAKTARTRSKRIADVVESLRAGQRPNPFRR